MHYVNDINLVPKTGQIIEVQRPVSSAPINGLYQRPVCDIRGHIYNSFAGGIIVQIILLPIICLPESADYILLSSIYLIHLLL